jgi:hypothetical protein
VGLKRGPLSLVSTTEEVHERKCSGSGLDNEITAVGIRCADDATPHFYKRWDQLSRQAVVIRLV